MSFGIVNHHGSVGTRHLEGASAVLPLGARVRTLLKPIKSTPACSPLDPAALSSPCHPPQHNTACVHADVHTPSRAAAVKDFSVLCFFPPPNHLVPAVCLEEETEIVSR